MADLSSGTGLLFAAGFAIQRVIEIFDLPLTALSEKLAGPRRTVVTRKDATGEERALEPEDVFGARKTAWKKMITGVLASGAGIAIAWFGELPLLSMVTGLAVNVPIDALVTGLAIGGGTEAINSLLKYASYAKAGREAKAEAGS